jgi:hypothetical protein
MAEKKLEDQFIENTSRYPLYFVSVLLGGVWAPVQSFVNLYKRNQFTAALVVAGAIGLLVFVTLTLRAMTGGTELAG